MLALKFLLEAIGFAMLAASAATLINDLYRRSQPRLRFAGRLAAYALLPLLAGISIVVVPAGSAAVRVNILRPLPGWLISDTAGPLVWSVGLEC